MVSPVTVDKQLLAPTQAVPHKAVRHLHAVDLLVVQRDGHGERVADAHVLRYQLLVRCTSEDPHVAAGHGRRGSQRCGTNEAGAE